MSDFFKPSVLDEVESEMVRQDKKWGQQDHPNGTGGDDLKALAMQAKMQTDDAAKRGELTWLHVLAEEFWEGAAEEDAAMLREELIQVAAVAVQWVYALDRATKEKEDE